MKGYEGDACGECGNFTLVPEWDVHEVHDLRLNKRVLVRLFYPLL